MSRVRLRDSTIDDLDVFYANERDEDAARMVNYPRRTRRAFNAHWRNKVFGVRGNIARTVEVDGEIAGNILCWDSEGEREIGYWFGREYWGRGIGTAAVRAFVGAIEHRPLYACVASGNGGSLRLLEKCGFQPAGSFLGKDEYGDGEIEIMKVRLD